MTIKQVLNAQQAFPEAPYMADGHEVGHVSIVACIRRVADQSTNLGLLLEDGTGVIDARMWHDESDTDYMAQKRGALRYVGTFT